ncbi:hypothetical protein [Ancylobacter sp. SL191]|uniref:hypothetical protein n=1 Tax=Ancylobacter sp. SL191 TaxID=2995166 RepID=UPI00227216FC|nr:hypothetical protein [Ancylobacter sp. SL191]WAC26303.1 hypothetical protein OU996_14955 [Ancylobacter sp. SL191]
MSRLLIAALLLAASSLTASAQWVSDKEGGAFDDDATHLAVTVAGDYVFGLRCRSDNLEAVFITPERIDDPKDVEAMNSVGAKLRVRADKGEILVFDAVAHEVKGTLGMVAEVDEDLFLEVMDADSSISVVITMKGENFHETKFNARGSTKALEEVADGCGISY